MVRGRQLKNLPIDRARVCYITVAQIVVERIAIDFSSRKVLFDLPDGGDPGYFGMTGDLVVPSRIKN